MDAGSKGQATDRPSRKISAIEESQTIAFTTRAHDLRRAGVDVISMTAGEPDAPTPDHIKAAAIEAINGNFTKYTAVQGIPEVIAAVQEKFERENGLHYSPRQIIVTTGAKQALINALFAICDDGDEVLISSPYWVSYPAMVQMAGALPVVAPSPAANGFRPDADAMEHAITPRTRAIIVNTPNNPTAQVYTRDELQALATLARKHGLMIISDEVYEGVVFDGRKHISIGSLPDARDITITVSGVSKTYAMTGWRVGFMGGPEKIMRAALKVQSQLTSNTNSIAQKACVAALRGPKDFIQNLAVEYQQRRDIAASTLRAVDGLDIVMPQGAMFFFLGMERLFGRRGPGGQMKSSLEVVEHLLDRHHVVLVPGTAFGDPSSVRMSFSCAMKDLEEGLRRIVRGINELH